jgi:AGZA family xanthine/uracil permease-like MFS transporter
MARRLARRTGRTDVTAMPLGLNAPSVFGMSFAVLGPAYLATGDAVLSWKMGMAVTVLVGLFKMALSFSGNAVRAAVPRAGLLGSIAGAGIALIAFLPFLKVFASPVVGFAALGVILVTLVAGVRLPFGLPGAFVSVVIGLALHYALVAAGLGPAAAAAAAPASEALSLAIPWPSLAFVGGLSLAWAYLPIALPFAVMTIVGGIDNTESALAAGDEYRTRDILLVEALATVLTGLCGGVIQNTPYIGHPAYKAMGARSGYTLATGLVIGLGAAVGALGALVGVLPEAAVAPILVFIGLEITAQAFLASPARHGAAVALTFVPVAAAVVLIELGGVLGALGRSGADLAGEAATTYRALLLLGNGFILTAVLWGSALVFVIERRAAAAAAVFAIASLATLCGLVHSPLPSGALFWPWSATAPLAVAAPLAGAYGALAALTLLAAGRARPR